MIYSLPTPQLSAVLFLHSPPLFPTPSPLLGRAKSWIALFWQDKGRDVTTFPFILLVPNGNVLRMKKFFITLCDYWLSQKVNEYSECSHTFWTRWCGSGSWLRQIGSFLHLFWLFHKTGLNTKQLGKGTEGFEEKYCGVCNPEHRKQSSCQMCCLSFTRKGIMKYF